MMRILFFSGIDGSGKTTHTRLLAFYLLKKGVRVRLVWMRWFAFFSYPLLALCRLLGLTKRLPNTPIPVREYWRYRSIAVTWLHLHLLDYLLYFVSKLAFSRGVIVADRFALDVFVDVAYDTHINPLKHIFGRFFLLFIYRLLRRGVVRGVVMTVDVEIVFRRRSDIPSRSYVTFRIPVYLSLARFLGLSVIDGREDLAKNFRRVVEALGV